MLNLNQPTLLQLFFVITFIKSELIVDPKYFLFVADFPAIEIDIELGCVKLEQEVTEQPRPVRCNCYYHEMCWRNI